MPNGNNFVADLARHIGQTVTIFTTSGGQSGRGFTGVLVAVNPCFVRLITQIGPAPGCALGNCCERMRRGPIRGESSGCIDNNFRNNSEVVADSTGYGDAAGMGFNNEFGDSFDPSAVAGTEFDPAREANFGERAELGGQGRATCRVNTLGAVVDIPVDRIASFVHNAVGTGF